MFLQLRGIKDVGGEHALRVATEILQSGRCAEVEEKRNERKFQTIQVQLKVFLMENGPIFSNFIAVVLQCIWRWSPEQQKVVRQRLSHTPGLV